MASKNFIIFPYLMFVRMKLAEHSNQNNVILTIGGLNQRSGNNLWQYHLAPGNNSNDRNYMIDSRLIPFFSSYDAQLHGQCMHYKTCCSTNFHLQFSPKINKIQRNRIQTRPILINRVGYKLFFKNRGIQMRVWCQALLQNASCRHVGSWAVKQLIPYANYGSTKEYSDLCK